MKPHFKIATSHIQVPLLYSTRHHSNGACGEGIMTMSAWLWHQLYCGFLRCVDCTGIPYYTYHTHSTNYTIPMQLYTTSYCIVVERSIYPQPSHYNNYSPVLASFTASFSKVSNSFTNSRCSTMQRWAMASHINI